MHPAETSRLVSQEIPWKKPSPLDQTGDGNGVIASSDRRRFVMLDRDGTIIRECHYLSDPDQVELIPGAASALRELSRMGLGLVVVTNQSGIGRGLFNHDRLEEIHDRFLELLDAEGVTPDGIYYCPHTPEDNCSCRKPRPGLVERASEELDFQPDIGFVVGDKLCDIELGYRIGATTFLVRTGYGAQEAQANPHVADYVVDSLWNVVSIIQLILRRESCYDAVGD